MIALLESARLGLLGRNHWPNNLMAGVIVGVVALPLAMAFAIASGLKPEQGITTAIVAGLLVSVFGGSRYQIAGPTGAFIVILLDIVGKYGVLGLQVATVMAGVMLVVMGLVKVGQLVKFIPDPVIVGFTSGIALLIVIGQVAPFLGLTVASTHLVHHKVLGLLHAWPQTHAYTAAFGVLALVLLLGMPKIPYCRRVPAPLWVLLVCGTLQAAFNVPGVATIGSTFGGIPLGLPTFQPLPFSFSMVSTLVGPAFTIAMLGAIESLLSAVVADGMTQTKHNPNQELIGQGLANMVAPFFGGFASTGAVARTATSIRYGASSPIAGVVHTLTLVVVLVALAPLADTIPLSALAAILFIVAYNMSELGHFIHMLRHAPRADVAILLITFLLTVFTDLVVAVNIGIILAMFYVLGRLASSAEVRYLDAQQLAEKLHEPTLAQRHPKLMVYSVEGPFFFAAADKFQSALSATHNDPSAIIIRLNHVPFIDATGLEAFDDALHALAKRNVRVVVCEANQRVHNSLRKSGVLSYLGPQGYRPTLQLALAHLEPYVS
jgi:sulfate permease, SulP family